MLRFITFLLSVKTDLIAKKNRPIATVVSVILIRFHVVNIVKLTWNYRTSSSSTRSLGLKESDHPSSQSRGQSAFTENCFPSPSVIVIPGKIKRFFENSDKIAELTKIVAILSHIRTSNDFHSVRDRIRSIRVRFSLDGISNIIRDSSAVARDFNVSLIVNSFVFTKLFLIPLSNITCDSD